MAAAYQGVWINRLISEMKGEEPTAVRLMVNNQSAITLTKNPIHHNQSKHIDTRYHFIKQCVEDKKIKIVYV